MEILNLSVIPDVLKMMNPRLIIVNIEQPRTLPIHVASVSQRGWDLGVEQEFEFFLATVPRIDRQSLLV